MYRFKRICVTLCATTVLSGAVQAQAPQQAAAPGRARAQPAVTQGTRPAVLAGTNASAFSVIQGNALSSESRPLPDAAVRLRDARLGRVVDRQVTDRSGLFAFRAVDPGTYVVELVADDQTILAASDVLTVNAGEVTSTLVQLPFHIAPFAGILGQSAGQALIIISTAVASGVLATQSIGDDISPE